MVPWSCTFGDENCLKGAYDHFNGVKDGNIKIEDIDINIREYSMNYGVRAGDEDDANYIFNLLMRSNNMIQEKRYATMLSYTSL